MKGSIVLWNSYFSYTYWCVYLHTHTDVGNLDHNVRCIYFLLKIVGRKVCKHDDRQWIFPLFTHTNPPQEKQKTSYVTISFSGDFTFTEDLRCARHWCPLMCLILTKTFWGRRSCLQFTGEETEAQRGSEGPLPVAIIVSVAEEGEEIKLRCPPIHQMVLICQYSWKTFKTCSCW